MFPLSRGYSGQGHGPSPPNAVPEPLYQKAQDLDTLDSRAKVATGTDRDGHVLGRVVGVDAAAEADDGPRRDVVGRLQELVGVLVRSAAAGQVGRVDVAILQVALAGGVVVAADGQVDPLQRFVDDADAQVPGAVGPHLELDVAGAGREAPAQLHLMVGVQPLRCPIAGRPRRRRGPAHRQPQRHAQRQSPLHGLASAKTKNNRRSRYEKRTARNGAEGWQLTDMVFNG